MAQAIHGIHLGPGDGRRAKSGPWVFKFTGDETGGSVSAIETYFQPGVLLAPPHAHIEDQSVIVIKGEIMMECGGETFTLVAGAVTFIPKGTIHCAWGSGQEPATVVEITSPAGFERYIMELDELIGSGRLDVPTMVARGAVYGVTYDLPHTMELVQKHGLKLPGGL